MRYLKWVNYEILIGRSVGIGLVVANAHDSIFDLDPTRHCHASLNANLADRSHQLTLGRSTPALRFLRQRRATPFALAISTPSSSRWGSDAIASSRKSDDVVDWQGQLIRQWLDGVLPHPLSEGLPDRELFVSLQGDW